MALHWMLEMRPLTAMQAINYGVPNKFEACKVEVMQHNFEFEFCSSLKWLVIKVINPNFISSILPNQEWSQGVLGHFGKFAMCYKTHLWISF